MQSKAHIFLLNSRLAYRSGTLRDEMMVVYVLGCLRLVDLGVVLSLRNRFKQDTAYEWDCLNDEAKCRNED